MYVMRDQPSLGLTCAHTNATGLSSRYPTCTQVGEVVSPGALSHSVVFLFVLAVRIADRRLLQDRCGESLTDPHEIAPA